MGLALRKSEAKATFLNEEENIAFGVGLQEVPHIECPVKGSEFQDLLRKLSSYLGR